MTKQRAPAPFVCGDCHRRFEGESKRTFLGFPRFVCPECETETLYPLSPVVRGVYWAVLLAGIVGTTLLVLDDRLPGGAVIVVLVGFALYEDLIITRQVRRNERAAKKPYTGRHESTRIAKSPKRTGS